MTTALVPYGLTDSQIGARIYWARVRAGEVPMPKRNAPKSHCRRGHLMRPENSAWSNGRRRCLACVAIRQGRAAWRERVVTPARTALITAHPDHGGTAAQSQTALRRYRTVAHRHL